MTTSLTESAGDQGRPDMKPTLRAAFESEMCARPRSPRHVDGGLGKAPFTGDLRAGHPPMAALLFSRLWVPLGNTGGANVSAFKPMAISEDLAVLLREPESDR